MQWDGVMDWSVSWYAEVLTPRSSGYDHIWKKKYCRCKWLRWGGSGVVWTFNPIWWLFLLKGGIYGQTHKQVECPVTMKAEVRMMQWEPRNTKDGQQSPGSQERWGRGFPPQPWEGTVPTHWSQISSLYKYEAKDFCCLIYPVLVLCFWIPSKLTQKLNSSYLYRQ